MNISTAVSAMRDDKKVARKNWNGKGMYLYIVPGASYLTKTEIAKEEFGETAPYREYIAMKTVDNEVVPWTASQTDILAEDWEII